MSKKNKFNNKCNRRENDDLDYFSKSIVKKIRKNIPGEYCLDKGKHSDFGLILRSKQKIKRYYCLFEKQFKKIFNNLKKNGFKFKDLINFLERRLDNMVYRMNFSITRKEARQYILHGFVLVNFKLIKSPSFITSPGDSIIINVFFLKKFLYDYKKINFLNWIYYDYFNGFCIFLSLPNKNKFFIDKNLLMDIYK